jgi:hypothetical protein
MPTSAIIPLHLILCTNIFNGYSESPIELLGHMSPTCQIFDLGTAQRHNIHLAAGILSGLQK